MEQDISQIVNAIAVASDPSQAALHVQALNFLGNVQKNAHTTWRLALSLFLDRNPDGSYLYSNDARFFALRVLDDFLDNRFESFDQETFQLLHQALVNYIQSEYVFGSAEGSAPYIRNKFSHTLTLFFLCVYIDTWPSFFSDILSLIEPQDPTHPYNPHLSLLFFRIVLEISGEVADQMIKSARVYNSERIQRDAKVRDLVRERDSPRVNSAVLAIVSQGKDRLVNELRKAEFSPEVRRQIDQTTELVEMGTKTFASYVGWIDINLTVTPTTVPLLFSMIADPALPIRMNTCIAVMRIVAKGLKTPDDKLQLLKVLSLNEVLDALETKTREEQQARTSDDESEESYRENLGKLLNTLGLELNKLVDDPAATPDIRAQASVYQSGLLPIALRFMVDEWDETCSTVFPFLQGVLGSMKRARKDRGVTVPLDESRRSFLISLMEVILTKSKWNIDDATDDPEDDTFQDFENLRRDLRVFIESILSLDVDLATNIIRACCVNTLSAYQNGSTLPWNEAELAVYLVYIYGECNKVGGGGKGRGAFCIAPQVDREKRKTTDYTAFPLSPLGEMLLAVVQSGIVSYPHTAVSTMFFETVSRYTDFFKIRKDSIMPTLEAFIDQRGFHRQANSHYRHRLYYLFHRFMKECRNDVPPDLCPPLVESIRDLLVIQLPQVDEDSGDSDSTIEDPLTSLTVNDTAFESQLYLYDSTGTAISLLYKTPEQQAALLLSVYKPLLDDLEASLKQYAEKPQELVVIAKIHHIILALGNIAKGFPDYPNPLPEGYILPPIQVFNDVAQAVLYSLEHMQTQKCIRDATRFAFSRILAATGPNVTHFVPALMSNLLSHFEPSELVDFINFLSLLIHKLQNDLFDVLDQLISPLSVHISMVLSQPISGTDAQRSHTETKRTYFGFLNNIMSSKLSGIFVSERNRYGFDDLLTNMVHIGEDLTDHTSSRLAFLFLERSILVWGSRSPTDGVDVGIAGIEAVIYERIVPAVFRACSQPAIQGKDASIITVINQLANVLGAVMKARGSEAYDFFLQVYLPSLGWPPDVATVFVNNLRDMDVKAFRKYFVEFVRTSRSQS